MVHNFYAPPRNLLGLDIVCCSSDEHDEEERCRGLLISGRDSPPLLEPGPQVFDQMSEPVSSFRTGDFWIIFPWRDDGTGTRGSRDIHGICARHIV